MAKRSLKMETVVVKTRGEPPFGGLLRAIHALVESQLVHHFAEAELDLRRQEMKHWRLDKIADLEPLQAHDMVTRGLPVILVREMMDSYELVGKDAVLLAIGVSERTLQRGKDASRLLDSNASDRLLRLAGITEHAIDVLGSQQEAERWLLRPALGLDQRRPIDLLQSSEGTELVKALLTRMDYGVYA
jgi:putative toxin-antitoxin system antitoxin component (TIGR02293 family)